MRFSLSTASLSGPTALLLGLLLSAGSWADDWRQIRSAAERTDVSTWVRPVAGNPLNAFRGQTEVPYPMLTAIAVLSDIERFPEWVFQCHAAKLLPEFGEDLAYIEIKGIWPVSDRDGVARTTIHQEPDTLITTIRSVAAPDIVDEVPGTVRIPQLENQFVFEPLADGWTRITFETQVDPGGMIPAWLANFVATRAPLTTLQKMQQQMKDSRYHLESSDQLPVQLPGTAAMTFPGGPPIR
ncbi:MAG: hypothetical protein CVV10_07840 [Gammaproteobacteria bacterium HGW-Gammaproteobacteria-14]|nr:MAG: hypothetical protein CVV10_07840 [Gammaproteobacteria bacterium HGW-Gammaproteobacteria-14]